MTPDTLLFSRRGTSESLWPHGLRHTSLLCPPLSPRVCSNSCPWDWWFSATPFSFCLQSFLESGSFLMSQLLPSGAQSFGASASATVLPMNIQSWFPLGLIDWFELLQSKELSWVFSSTTIQKHQFFSTQPSLRPTSHIHTWLLEKPELWLCGPLSAKWYLCLTHSC